MTSCACCFGVVLLFPWSVVKQGHRNTWLTVSSQPAHIATPVTVHSFSIFGQHHQTLVTGKPRKTDQRAKPPALGPVGAAAHASVGTCSLLPFRAPLWFPAAMFVPLTARSLPFLICCNLEKLRTSNKNAQLHPQLKLFPHQFPRISSLTLSVVVPPALSEKESMQNCVTSSLTLTRAATASRTARSALLEGADLRC
ncbi:hypothetical protein TRVL_01300 [Trypanosoma vivax]|nr:hypothetical protein TRVL_01300 [Trypanosoma vivax]